MQVQKKKQPKPALALLHNDAVKRSEHFKMLSSYIQTDYRNMRGSINDALNTILQEDDIELQPVRELKLLLDMLDGIREDVATDGAFWTEVQLQNMQ